MRLKDEIISKLKGNFGLRRDLQKQAHVSRTTIWNWLENNDDNLTKAAHLRLIASHYNRLPDDLLEETPITTTEKHAA